MKFMHQLQPSRNLVSLTCCAPVDIKRFLMTRPAWENKVHKVECACLIRKCLFDCYCRFLLGSGTVSLLILRLVNFFFRVFQRQETQQLLRPLRNIESNSRGACTGPYIAYFQIQVRAFASIIQRELEGKVHKK